MQQMKSFPSEQESSLACRLYFSLACILYFSWAHVDYISIGCVKIHTLYSVHGTNFVSTMNSFDNSIISKVGTENLIEHNTTPYLSLKNIVFCYCMKDT